MVLALGDPYSSYLSLEQSQELGTSINGTFEGIGITYTMVDDGAIVLDVYQNTPAQKQVYKKEILLRTLKELQSLDIHQIKLKK